MTVFKACLKLIKSYLPTILMYFGIFLMVTILVGSVGSNNTGFEVSKPKVFIINHDNSDITNDFIKYVSSNAEIVDIKNKEQGIKDALFYRKVDFVLEIPNNYGQDLVDGYDVKIETMSIENSVSKTYTEMLLNKYFNAFKVYLSTGINEKEIIKLMQTDLKEETNIQMLDTSKKDIDKVNYFFNYTNYTILAVCILVIGLVINTFNDQRIKRRNTVSSMTYRKVNIELFLGNVCLTIIIWLSYIVTSVILYRKTMLTINGLLYIINSFLFSIMALSLGMLIGNLVHNKEAQSGIVNIISLGTSFICGAFVPQEYLGASVLTFARVLPSYWYVLANNKIGSLSIINQSNIMPIISIMGIILLFAVFFFIINNYLSKRRLKEN